MVSQLGSSRIVQRDCQGRKGFYMEKLYPKLDSRNGARRSYVWTDDSSRYSENSYPKQRHHKLFGGSEYKRNILEGRSFGAIFRSAVAHAQEQLALIALLSHLRVVHEFFSQGVLLGLLITVLLVLCSYVV